MRGYFAIGAERISKPMNFGAILRTGHAFGASFAFTVNAHPDAQEMNLADTAKSAAQLPLYQHDSVEALMLPVDCQLVGVELTDEAIDLPSFRHPAKAAYILGPEKGELSPLAIARCVHMVKIPTKFCVNLSVAAAIVMYDRVISIGGHPPRPIKSGGPPPDENWRPARLR
ncbi:MAG: RNA methyltransferase [Marinicaulis sp.]|nr:RNA methyltransferase [Marinicaulis sp.]NNE40687.1 RNA methyltransferase [Marinicaulis sp.]